MKKQRKKRELSMKRYIKSDSEPLTTSKFHPGHEYKLYKKSGEEAVRTFTVEKVSHNKLAVMVKGGIHGIFNMKVSRGGDEMILLGMSDRNYLNPSSKDIIR